jgi:hypothetical protein
VRQLVAVAVTTSLLLAGCGGSNALDDIQVGDGSNPTVEVPEGFETTSTETRVIEEGGGEEVSDGDSVKVNYVAVNGRTGEQFDNSFSGDTTLTVPLVEGGVMPGFIKGLSGQKIGSRVLVAINPEDGFGQAQEQLDIQADDSLVFLFDIVSKIPTQATGEEQPRRRPRPSWPSSARASRSSRVPASPRTTSARPTPTARSSTAAGSAAHRRRSRWSRSSHAGATPSPARRSAAASSWCVRPTPPTATSPRATSPLVRWSSSWTCSTPPERPSASARTTLTCWGGG